MNTPLQTAIDALEAITKITNENGTYQCAYDALATINDAISAIKTAHVEQDSRKAFEVWRESWHQCPSGWEAFQAGVNWQATQPQDDAKDAALAFVDEVLCGVFEGCNFDGADLQDMAVNHGLLKEVTMSESCGESCACNEACADFPTTCYRKTYLAFMSSQSKGEQNA